jgi:hypothetical protein
VLGPGSLLPATATPFSALLSSGDRNLYASGTMHPGGSFTGMGGDADRGCFSGAAPVDCHGGDTCTTHFQQYGGSAFHCGHFRTLCRRRTLRIDWGVLAIPVVGVLQKIIVAIWHRWEHKHPEKFPPEGVPLQQAALLPEQKVTSIDIPAPDVRS